MENVWLNRRLKRQTFNMPVTLNDDREVEFAPIKGRQIPKLIEFWAWHLNNGSLTIQEHRAISALLIYAFERQMGQRLRFQKSSGTTP